MRLTPLLLVMLLCLTSTGAEEAVVDMSAEIKGKLLLPSSVFKANAIGVVVDGGHVTYVRGDGTFLITLQAGVHVVDFSVRGFQFPQLRVVVSKKQKGSYRVMYNDKNRDPAPDPLEIQPLAFVEYFEEHEPINWLGFLLNPTMLTMLLPLALLYMMPRGAMDDEMKKQMKQMPRGGGLSGMLQSMMQPPQQTAAPVARR
eukprot:Sspe_Gene.49176::Locus_26224_Transcript_1_1_Confidence_1.000_Length_749::g.49176::m.49176